jgi:hypothetical protein
MLVIKHILGKLLGAIKYSIFGLKKFSEHISMFLVQGLRNLKPIDSDTKKKINVIFLVFIAYEEVYL